MVVGWSVGWNTNDFNGRDNSSGQVVVAVEVLISVRLCMMSVTVI